jgi:hypothetical protein
VAPPHLVEQLQPHKGVEQQRALRVPIAAGQLVAQRAQQRRQQCQLEGGLAQDVLDDGGGHEGLRSVVGRLIQELVCGCGRAQGLKG